MHNMTKFRGHDESGGKRRPFIALIPCIKKLKRSSTSNLIPYLKALKQKEASTGNNQIEGWDQ